MKISEKTTAKRVNMPMMLRIYRLIAIGAISAVKPTPRQASTITVPHKSPIAISECPFRTLCSEKVNSGSVVPSATRTSPMSMAGTPIPMASVSELLTIKCALTIMTAMLTKNTRPFLR